ncbi:hypothetical protein [Macrococcus lamae]|uniref:DUF1659 domain-containing protein n=1 Tax=Macrococcus lamae TaxID=198484 RepID=A0A4V6PPR9_9STAP|nr:hypothetical protein [Macrococcus lamae]TDM07041.1 hypothetical protein ERX29_09650 [Macrococcus lamae]
MLKEVVLSLIYISDVSESGKETRKSRRFSQVRMDLTEPQANSFKDLISILTGEDYVAAEKIETKTV